MNDTTITLQSGATLNLYQGLTKGYLDAAILDALKPISEGITKMSQALDDLKTEVAALTSVDASAIALLQGLKTALDQAVANSDMAAVASITAELHARTGELAKAVTDNTPAA